MKRDTVTHKHTRRPFGSRWKSNKAKERQQKRRDSAGPFCPLLHRREQEGRAWPTHLTHDASHTLQPACNMLHGDRSRSSSEIYTHDIVNRPPQLWQNGDKDFADDINLTGLCWWLISYDIKPETRLLTAPQPRQRWNWAHSLSTNLHSATVQHQNLGE